MCDDRGRQSGGSLSLVEHPVHARCSDQQHLPATQTRTLGKEITSKPGTRARHAWKCSSTRQDGSTGSAPRNGQRRWTSIRLTCTGERFRTAARHMAFPRRSATGGDVSCGYILTATATTFPVRSLALGLRSCRPCQYLFMDGVIELIVTALADTEHVRSAEQDVTTSQTTGTWLASARTGLRQWIPTELSAGFAAPQHAA